MRLLGRRSGWLLSVVCLLLTGLPTRGGVVLPVSSTAELVKAAQQARPGTRIVVAPGNYKSCFLSGVTGTPEAWVEIVARDPEKPPLFSGGITCFQLVKSSYVLVDGLVATGAEANNVQVGDGSHHIALSRIRSVRTGGIGNCDGIKMPGLTDFLVYRCVLEDWGGGGSAIDMVGCARGLILDSQFRNPRPRGQDANCVQAKGGSFSIGVHRCFFEHANFRAVQFGGMTGRDYFFRGNYDAGYEATGLVAVGNVFTGGEAAVALVSCADCVVSHNTIDRPEKYVVRILKEGGLRPTGRNTVARNLILWSGGDEPFNVGGDIDLPSFTVEENFWFCPAYPKHSFPQLPLTERSQRGGKDPLLDPAFRPAPGSPGADYGAFAPGASVEWSRHTGLFPWAWEAAQSLRSRQQKAAPTSRAQAVRH